MPTRPGPASAKRRTRGFGVGYFVEFVDEVLDYLGKIEGLTDEDRATIVDGVIEELARDADRFLALFPLAHESLCFRYDYAHVVYPTVFNLTSWLTLSTPPCGSPRRLRRVPC